MQFTNSFLEKMDTKIHSILITYHQGDVAWEKYPVHVVIDGVISDMNALRELVLGFQPQRSRGYRSALHPFKDPKYDIKKSDKPWYPNSSGSTISPSKPFGKARG